MDFRNFLSEANNVNESKRETVGYAFYEFGDDKKVINLVKIFEETDKFGKTKYVSVLKGDYKFTGINMFGYKEDFVIKEDKSLKKLISDKKIFEKVSNNFRTDLKLMDKKESEILEQ